jgi:hypothetical protein
LVAPQTGDPPAGSDETSDRLLFEGISFDLNDEDSTPNPILRSVGPGLKSFEELLGVLDERMIDRFERFRFLRSDIGKRPGELGESAEVRR